MEKDRTRLILIAEMVTNGLSRNMLMSTHKLLKDILDVATDENLPITGVVNSDCVQIYCDASVKNNPGGPSAVGWVVVRDGKESIFGELSQAKTNNQAEYDAVYCSLVSFFNLNHNPRSEVVIFSDSKLVISQLRGEMKCNDPTLNAKREGILEFIAALPVNVYFEWRPRNSTSQLEQANYRAQDLLGVKRH